MKTTHLLLVFVTICKQIACLKIYNKTFETCCDGEVFKSITGFDCCGKQLYNSSNKFCYNDEIQEFVEGKSYCGDKAYDDDGKFKCCNNEILYDSSKYNTCCGKAGFWVEKNATVSCCGDRLYNTNLEACCYKPEKKSHYTLLLDKADPKKTSCCGEKVYNYYIESCCQGVLHPVPWGVCCGTKLMDLNTETCCTDGTSFPIKGPWQACCAGKLYDKSENLCCNDIWIPDTKNGDKCCGSKRYNSYKQDCCYDTVIDKLKIGTACCAPYSTPLPN